MGLACPIFEKIIIKFMVLSEKLLRNRIETKVHLKIQYSEPEKSRKMHHFIGFP